MSRNRMLACAVALLAVAVPAEASANHFAKRDLAVGAEGKDVRVLQDFLNRAGFKTSIDGHYGRATARAMRRWEQAHNTKVDGRASRAEQRTMTAQFAGAASPEQLPPPPPPEKATITKDGLAVAPAGAPAEVVAIIEAGNKIAHKRYRYGGGHGRWRDSGYDCSGSISYALHGAGLLKRALDSGSFMSWGKPGKGRWVSIYAHGGHAYMVVAGLRFDTSAYKADGSRWTKQRRSSRGYRVRHPRGL